MLAIRTNPEVRCVGVCANTSGLQPNERKRYLEQLAVETGLPVVDPVIDGCAPIARSLIAS